MDIPPEHVFPDLEAIERYSAIREILQRLIRLGAIPATQRKRCLPPFVAARKL